MPATITPISRKHGEALGKVQEAVRTHAELTILLGQLQAQVEADPFDFSRIEDLAAKAERRATSVEHALNGAASLFSELDTEAYERRERERERERARRWPRGL